MLFVRIDANQLVSGSHRHAGLTACEGWREEGDIRNPLNFESHSRGAVQFGHKDDSIPSLVVLAPTLPRATPPADFHGAFADFL